MTEQQLQKMVALAGEFIQKAFASGLTWDESVAAMGIASNALADLAAKNGDGSRADCLQKASKRLSEGFAQHTMLEIHQVEGASASDIARRRMGSSATRH